MKHITVSKAVLPLLLIIAGIGISLPSLANADGPARHSDNPEAEVRYISGKSGEVLFNVLYNNISGSRFSVMILDENGNPLYQQSFTGRNFDKTFKLADPEIASKLTFVIRNFGDNSVQRFEVHAIDHLVEDVEVKEVN